MQYRDTKAIVFKRAFEECVPAQSKVGFNKDAQAMDLNFMFKIDVKGLKQIDEIKKKNCI